MGWAFVKLYLDDDRKTPEGWDRVFTAWDCIALLKAGQYETISLDHDLGLGYFDHDKGQRIDPGNGHDVLTWMEKEVFTNPSYVPPKILIHSSNASAVVKMRLAVLNIEHEVERRATSKTTEDR